jgi:hypothetical protein
MTTAGYISTLSLSGKSHRCFSGCKAPAMKIFGVTEFAARFPNAICGIITLMVVFICGSKIYDRKFGVLWALAFGGSLFPNMYFKSGIIDPWFNLFTFLSLFNFILYHWARNGFDKDGLKKNPLYYVVWSGIFMGTCRPDQGAGFTDGFFTYRWVFILFTIASVFILTGGMQSHF